jgi:hypothetical protein
VSKAAKELRWIGREINVQETVRLTRSDIVQSHERFEWIHRGDFLEDAQKLLLVSQAAYADELRIDPDHGGQRRILLN